MNDETGKIVRLGVLFRGAALVSLLAGLTACASSISPFNPPPAGPLARTAHFVEPTLVCHVAYAEWTDDDKIRHPVYRGLAEGVDPNGVRRG